MSWNSDEKTSSVARRCLVLHPDVKSLSKFGTFSPRAFREPSSRLEEAISLSKSIKLDVCMAQVILVNRPKPATLMGSGIVDKFQCYIEQKNIDVVVLDGIVSPVQQRNLELAWKAKVIDRTALILEIFGARARTKEGKLQVELAALNYQRSRLVRSWTHLERQRGGFGFMGGPGESQIETDRRLIDNRISKLKGQLKEVRRTRGLHRRARKRIPYPIVALVGYTNAGKSSLFLALSGKEVLVEDKLFSTLETTVGRMQMSPRILLADTIGFIDNLPSDLLDAFHATLDESLQCDLLLLLVDSSDEITEFQRKLSTSRREVLDRSDGEALSMLVILTKSDKGGDIEAAKEVVSSMGMSEPIVISSHSNQGMMELRESIMHSLYGSKTTLIVSAGAPGERSAQAYVSQIYDLGIVTNKDELELTLWCGKAELERLISKSDGRISIK